MLSCDCVYVYEIFNFITESLTQPVQLISVQLSYYRVAQIKRRHFTFLLVTNECFYKII